MDYDFISETLFCGACDYQVENEFAWCRRCGELGIDDHGRPNHRDGGRIDLPFYGVTLREYRRLSRQEQDDHDYYVRRRLDSRFGRTFWHLPPRQSLSLRDVDNPHHQSRADQGSRRVFDSRARRYNGGYAETRPRHEDTNEDQSLAQQHGLGPSRTTHVHTSQSRERYEIRQSQAPGRDPDEQESIEEKEETVPGEGTSSQAASQTSPSHQTEIGPGSRVPDSSDGQQDPLDWPHASSLPLGSARVKIWPGATCWCGEAHPQQLHDKFDQFLEVVYYVVTDGKLGEDEACRNCGELSRAKSHTTNQCGRKCYYDHPDNPKVNRKLKPFIRPWPKRTYCRFRPFPRYYYFPERFPYPGAPLPPLPEAGVAGISAGLVDLDHGSEAMAISLALTD